MTKKNIINYLSEPLKELFMGEKDDFFSYIKEIRLRVNRPLIIYKDGGEITITPKKEISTNINKGYIVTDQDIKKTMELISNFSLYAFENEIKNGYITIPGGHRIGICGQVVMEGPTIKLIKNFSGLNLRLSHQIFGCGDKVINHIVDADTGQARHTMIISPPACGKTTLLRDIIRQLSTGDGQRKGLTVGLVDERSEIAGSYLGVAQNDLGPRTDVLDACPKALGMVMLLRSMAPKVIAVDELGKTEDIQALDDIINAGVKVICTVHGKDIEDIRKKAGLKDILNKKVFQRYIVLGQVGKIVGIYNEEEEK